MLVGDADRDSDRLGRLARAGRERHRWTGRLEGAVPVQVPGVCHVVAGRVASCGGQLGRVGFLDGVRTTGIHDRAIADGIEPDDDRVVIRHAEAVGRVQARQLGRRFEVDVVIENGGLIAVDVPLDDAGDLRHGAG